MPHLSFSPCSKSLFICCHTHFYLPSTDPPDEQLFAMLTHSIHWHLPENYPNWLQKIAATPISLTQHSIICAVSTSASWSLYKNMFWQETFKEFSLLSILSLTNFLLSMMENNQAAYQIFSLQFMQLYCIFISHLPFHQCSLQALVLLFWFPVLFEEGKT